MSDITFQPDQPTQSYTNLPSSTQIIQAKLPTENNCSSDTSSETSSATKVASDFKPQFLNKSKENSQQTKQKKEKSNSIFCQSHNFQDNYNRIRGEFQQQMIADSRNSEDFNSVQLDERQQQKQQQQQTGAQTIWQEIENNKMKLKETISRIVLNRKRKQNEVSNSSQNQQKDDIHQISNKNENKNSLNRLKVEESSLPRKALKMNKCNQLSKINKEDNSKILHNQNNFEQDLQLTKKSQPNITNYNQIQNLPCSVSSIEDSEESFPSENLEIAQQNEQESEKALNINLDGTNKQLLLQLIEKVKNQFIQKIQQIHNIQDETQLELEQMLKQIQAHSNHQDNYSEQQDNQMFSKKVQSLFDKVNTLKLLNKNGSLDQNDVKLCQLIHKMATQENIPNNEINQENRNNQNHKMIEVQSQLSSDNESMECREESISDLVQSSNFNSNSVQIQQPGQQLSETVSSSDDSALSNEEQELEMHENDSDIFIPDSDDQSENSPKFDSSQHENDYILILDLDNTLVHSYMGGPSVLGKEDPTVNKIETHFNQQKLYIKRRPYLKEFFEVAFKNFKVVMYTLGSLGYAKAVYYLFKKQYPEIFSEHNFLKIIAQNTQKTSAHTSTQQISSPQVSIQQTSSNQSVSEQKVNSNLDENQQEQKCQDSQQNCQRQQPKEANKFLKNISKYFPPEKFSKRLLIFDDNSRVYEQIWQNNAIFTKPFYYWMNNNNSISTSSDSFLFFAAELLKRILRHTPNHHYDLPLIYKIIRRQLLHKCKFFIQIDNPERENLEVLIKEFGGIIIEQQQQQQQVEEEIYLPDYIILNELSQNNIDIQQYAFNHGIKVVSSDWIKYCFLLNFKVSSDIFVLQNYIKYQQSQANSNLETDLVDKYILQTQNQNSTQKQ